MSTSDKDQKSDKSKHARSVAEQKSGKGSGRFDDDDESTSPANRAKTKQNNPGNHPQTFSNKVSETGKSEDLARPRKSDKIDDEEE